MKFVILSNKIIPGFNVKGPVMSPMEYDVHQVLKWISSGIDVREVMEDGSYRKLSFNDDKLMDELYKKSLKTKESMNKNRIKVVDNSIKPNGNVKLKPEQKINVPKKKEQLKKIVEEKKVVEQQKTEDQIDLIIDDLEKPE